MAGAFLLLIGYLRLGAYIKYIPHSVAVGFTASIALIIFASQLHELFGLKLAHEPAEFIPKVQALWAARDSANVQAMGVAGTCLALIIGLRVVAPRLPGFLIAVMLAAAATYFFSLPIETVGTRFGAVPRMLPARRRPPPAPAASGGWPSCALISSPPPFSQVFSPGRLPRRAFRRNR
jgi:SulP family sulfate permease